MIYNITSAISYPNYRDFTSRKKLNNLFELNRILIKMYLIDKRIKYNLKFLLKIKYLTNYGKKFSRFRSLCRVTGKSRFVFSYFNLNRSMLKHFLSCGYISGFKHG